MIEKIRDYFEREYKDVKSVIDDNPWWATPKDLVNNSVQRMYGIVMFVQTVDDTIEFEELSDLYHEYRKKVEKLLTDWI